MLGSLKYTKIIRRHLWPSNPPKTVDPSMKLELGTANMVELSFVSLSCYSNTISRYRSLEPTIPVDCLRENGCDHMGSYPCMSVPGLKIDMTFDGEGFPTHRVEDMIPMLSRSPRFQLGTPALSPAYVRPKVSANLLSSLTYPVPLLSQLNTCPFCFPHFFRIITPSAKYTPSSLSFYQAARTLLEPKPY